MDYDDNNFRHCRNEGRISYMSFNYVAKLPIPMEVKKQFPISDELKALKAEKDAEIRKIFTGEDDRFLVVIGPCSADNPEALYEYLGRLRKVADEVSDKLVIIPRIYTGKPRTNGDGYKGILHQPDGKGRGSAGGYHCHP
jgi:3-deoxy-7-phosphoheptulonate synthase